ncbi:hypothetical protein [Acanthopleuribacter pedis]|uniref:Uncharacterized protein n=1 Tax=Acanthopleuribacter pedis TaxID=442870 RepID=A0A8J7QEY5_9BACT|nr:hypothetical protein [Acanthopleuribacter pedis]MBO1317140.1 hypothetical protein [Acanthopleuribacter pedis]
MFKKLALIGLLMGCLVTAQDPSIRIIEQDCTSGTEFVLLQARIYNSGGKQVRVDYRYSSQPDKENVPLTLFADEEDDTLFWAFLPETPEMKGVSSGILEYTISVESGFGEVFSESGVMEVTPRCSFNPEYNSGQAGEMANLKNLLGKEEQIRLQKLALQRTRRSRNVWVGGSLLAGVGAALVLGSDDGDGDAQVVVSVDLQPVAGDDLTLSVNGIQGNGFNDQIPASIGEAAVTQTGAFDMCIRVSDTFDVTRRESRTLVLNGNITVDNQEFVADLVSVSSTNLPSELTLTQDGNNIQVVMNLSSVLQLIQDRARFGTGPDVNFTDNFVCDSNVVSVRVQFTLEIRKRG